MRKCKFQQASALAEKIGKIITRKNSSRLANIGCGGADMWDEVRRLTGASKAPSLPPNITAEILNAHYSAISTNSSYSPPLTKVTVLSYPDLITEFSVFQLLDRLLPTASGPDNIPFWFLRQAAPFITTPLTHLFNLSIQSFKVPSQWKSAIIHPIPKITRPTEPSHMRPISVVSILSRLIERLIVRYSLNPILSTHPQLSNQFAYRPTCSTTAAIITILAHVTHLLESNTHVHVLTFDYSKAFDTLSHTSVACTLDNFSTPDNIFNWILDYLSSRSHQTTHLGVTSSTAAITSGVIQGSVLGPTLFNMASSTLSPSSPLNQYFKYADDGYLIVPGSNADSIPLEMQHHSAWASQQNLKLNLAKTSEIVFSRKRSIPPPPIPGVERVSTLKILGVLVDDKLNFQAHTTETVKSCSQALFALRTLRHHGLSEDSLRLIFASKILSKLTYASSAWWGFASAASRDQLEAALRKARQFNYYSPTQANITDLVQQYDYNLFKNITADPHHCLHSLLPPIKQTAYNLRPRGHNFCLPNKDDRNFINRVLFSFL